MGHDDNNQGGRLGHTTKRLVRLAAECIESEEALFELYDEVTRLLEDGSDSVLTEAIKAAEKDAAWELKMVVEDVAYSPDDLLCHPENETPVSMELIGIPVCFLVSAKALEDQPDLLDRIPIQEFVHALRRHLPLRDDDSSLLMSRMIAPESLAAIQPSAIRKYMRSAAENICAGTDEGQYPIRLPIGMEPFDLPEVADKVVCSRIIVGCLIGDEEEELLGHRYLPGESPVEEEMLHALTADLEQQIAGYLPGAGQAVVTVMPAVLPLPAAPAEASAGRLAMVLACKVDAFMNTLAKLQAQVRHNLCYYTVSRENSEGADVDIFIVTMPNKEVIFRHEATLFNFQDDRERFIDSINYVFEAIGIPRLNISPQGDPEDNVIPFPTKK